MSIRCVHAWRTIPTVPVFVMLSFAGCGEGTVAKDQATVTAEILILPVITLDRSGQQEVAVEIRNIGADDIVYHRQSWPTPIYFFDFDLLMEGKTLDRLSYEGDVFSKEGIRRLAPGKSLSCSIDMQAYDLPNGGTAGLPVGRYQMNAFYHMGKGWDAYQQRYGMTPVRLNRAVALIDVIDGKSDLRVVREDWADHDIQKANLSQGSRSDFTDDLNAPLAAVPIMRFDRSQESKDVRLEIQNVTSEAIRYRIGNNRRPLGDLELILTRQGGQTPIRDLRSPHGSHSVTTLEGHQSIALSISLNDFEFGGTGGVPPGRYELRAKYLADAGSVADGKITPLEFDRTILLIDVVED